MIEIPEGKPAGWREQAIVYPRGEAVLEALIHRGRGAAAVVAPPHPLLGGSMDSPVVAEVAFALGRRGASTLRFNFRGVGASQGEPSGDPRSGLEDFLAGADELLATVETDGYVASGYSFGASVALLAALEDARVEGLLLVSPPLVAIPVAGAPTDADPGEGFSQALARLRISAAVVVGECDPYCPAERLKALVEPLGTRVRLRVIPGADHFFMQGLSEVGRAASETLPGLGSTGSGS